MLVIDQGTLLDSVEYNIEQTAVQVQEAAKELDIATRFVICSTVPTPTASIPSLMSSFLLSLPTPSRMSSFLSSFPAPHLPRRLPSQTLWWNDVAYRVHWDTRQIPEEHGPAEVHLLTAAHHLRARRRPHLQAAPARDAPATLSFGTGLRWTRTRTTASVDAKMLGHACELYCT